MELEECFRKRLLRKISPDKLKSGNSLKIAENKLLRAKELFAKDFFNEVLVSAYTSIFQSARALLYLNGVQEKSHFATILYLEKNYSKKISSYLIEAFKVYQLDRHKVLYDLLDEISSEEAELSIEDAEGFLIEIKELINNKK